MFRLVKIFLGAGCLLAAPLAAQDLIWENQGLVDENTITSGSTFAYNGATVTFTWTVVDNGGFGIYPGGSGSTGGGNDFVTYEASQEGGHTGLVLLAFDNVAYDPSDYIQVVMTFSAPQSRLAFSLLDLDSDGWDDNVQVFVRPAGGSFVNTIGFPQVWDFAQSNTSLRTVEINDEAQAGWEGTRDRAAPTDNWGNVDLNFDGIAIDAIAVRFRSTDDSGGNPGGQKIGFSDFVVVPEVGAFWAMALLAGCMAMSRRRPPRGRTND